MIGKIISKTADGKIKWTLVGANAYASGLKGSVYELKKKTLLISDEKVKATAEEIADLRMANQDLKFQLTKKHEELNGHSGKND